jgi:hypothetical protein
LAWDAPFVSKGLTEMISPADVAGYAFSGVQKQILLRYAGIGRTYDCEDSLYPAPGRIAASKMLALTEVTRL